MHTSVFPMTDPGPGSGGAKIHQSFNELTRLGEAGTEAYERGVIRTVGVLALRRLVGSCPALVRAGLSFLGLLRGVRRQVSGGICLCADA